MPSSTRLAYNHFAKKMFFFKNILFYRKYEEAKEGDESGKTRRVGNSGRGSMRTPWLLSCARVVRFTQIYFRFLPYSTLLLDAA